MSICQFTCSRQWVALGALHRQPCWAACIWTHCPQKHHARLHMGCLHCELNFVYRLSHVCLHCKCQFVCAELRVPALHSWLCIHADSSVLVGFISDCTMLSRVCLHCKLNIVYMLSCVCLHYKCHLVYMLSHVCLHYQSHFVYMLWCVCLFCTLDFVLSQVCPRAWSHAGPHVSKLLMSCLVQHRTPWNSIRLQHAWKPLASHAS